MKPSTASSSVVTICVQTDPNAVPEPNQSTSRSQIADG
jgi:hypothetical protein